MSTGGLISFKIMRTKQSSSQSQVQKPMYAYDRSSHFKALSSTILSFSQTHKLSFAKLSRNSAKPWTSPRTTLCKALPLRTWDCFGYAVFLFFAHTKKSRIVVIGNAVIGRKSIKLNFWFMNTFINEKRITKSMLKHSNGVLLIYDSTSASALTKIEIWRKEIVTLDPLGDLLIFVIANSLDVSRPKMINAASSKTYCDVNRFHFLELVEAQSYEHMQSVRRYEEDILRNLCKALMRKFPERKRPSPQPFTNFISSIMKAPDHTDDPNTDDSLEWAMAEDDLPRNSELFEIPLISSSARLPNDLTLDLKSPEDLEKKSTLESSFSRFFSKLPDFSAPSPGIN